MRFRDARREDLEAIVALLADDALGAAREDLAKPLSQAYLAAFDEISAQIGNRLIVVVDDDEQTLGAYSLR